MRDDEFQRRWSAFVGEFTRYIGESYLSEKGITPGDDTRFDSLNFDIVDEVVTEHLVETHFGLDGFTCDTWPDTLGSLRDVVRHGSVVDG